MFVVTNAYQVLSMVLPSTPSSILLEHPMGTFAEPLSLHLCLPSSSLPAVLAVNSAHLDPVDVRSCGVGLCFCVLLHLIQLHGITCSGDLSVDKIHLCTVFFCTFQVVSIGVYDVYPSNSAPSTSMTAYTLIIPEKEKIECNRASTQSIVVDLLDYHISSESCMAGCFGYTSLNWYAFPSSHVVSVILVAAWQ